MRLAWVAWQALVTMFSSTRLKSRAMPSTAPTVGSISLTMSTLKVASVPRIPW